MIGIVRIALSRPLTFIVMAIVILLGGILAALRTPVDIFPEIRVPVIAVAWQYAGLSPEDMAGRITTVYEKTLAKFPHFAMHPAPIAAILSPAQSRAAGAAANRSMRRHHRKWQS